MVSKQANIEFWFEFGSTYSYPAAMRIEPLASAHAIRIDWRAFLLGPIFRESGWNDSPFNLFPAKGRYMWRDLERICDESGIPLTRPSAFPRSGLLASRVACRFAKEPWIPGFVKAVYVANFVEDRDISTTKTVSDCLADFCDDPAEVIAEAQSPASKERLRQQTAQAASRGMFGAPSFIAGEELFWGNDRLESALKWAREHAA